MRGLAGPQDVQSDIITIIIIIITIIIIIIIIIIINIIIIIITIIIIIISLLAIKIMLGGKGKEDKNIVNITCKCNHTRYNWHLRIAMVLVKW